MKIVIQDYKSKPEGTKKTKEEQQSLVAAKLEGITLPRGNYSVSWPGNDVKINVAHE